MSSLFRVLAAFVVGSLLATPSHAARIGVLSNALADKTAADYSAKIPGNTYTAVDVSANVPALEPVKNRQIVLIGHSRGGVLARQALVALSAMGAPVLSRITTCITLHAPNLGSTLANTAIAVNGAISAWRSSLASIPGIPVGAAFDFQYTGLALPVKEKVLQQAVAEAECIEHLDGAARDAIRLAHQQRTAATFDDARPDRRKLRQLRRQHESRGTASDNEHVDRLGHLDARCALGRRFDRGIADAETVQMKLHGVDLHSSVRQCDEEYTPYTNYLDTFL